MNPFDMAVVIIIGFMAILGIFRGLIREVTAIAGLLAGFYCGYFFYQPVGDLFSRYGADGAYVNIVSFILLFCLTFLVITLAGVLIRYLMNLALLGLVDRVLGALFGAVKGVLIVSFGYLLLVTFAPRGGGQMVAQSKLGPPVYALSKTIIRVVPAGTRDRLFKQLQSLNEKVESSDAAREGPVR